MSTFIFSPSLHIRIATTTGSLEQLVPPGPSHWAVAVLTQTKRKHLPTLFLPVSPPSFLFFSLSVKDVQHSRPAAYAATIRSLIPVPTSSLRSHAS
jgi:hypothetical protein